MPSRIKNNFIPKKILERFIKDKGPKEPNKAHGSWYYNGMIPSLQPIAKRFNVMLALRGDPDYVPTPNQIKELAKDMYPDDQGKQNWILQRMLIMAEENKQKHRIKEYLEKTQQYNEFHDRDDLNEDLERFKERYGEKAEPPTYQPKGIYPSDKALKWIDEGYNPHDGYDPDIHLLNFDPMEQNQIQYITTNESYPLDERYILRGMQGKTYIAARKQTIGNADRNKRFYQDIRRTLNDQNNILSPANVDFYTTVATTGHDKRDRDSINRVVFREPYNYQGITTQTLQNAVQNYNHNDLLKEKIREKRVERRGKRNDRAEKIQRLDEMIQNIFNVSLDNFKKIIHNPNKFTEEKRRQLQDSLIEYCRGLDLDPADVDESLSSSSPPSTSTPSAPSAPSSSDGSSNSGGAESTSHTFSWPFSSSSSSDGGSSSGGTSGTVVEAADGTPSLGSFLDPWWISSNENSSSNVSTVTPQFDRLAATTAATESSTNSPSSAHSARVIPTADGTSTSSLFGAAEYSEKAATAAAPETMRTSQTPQTAQIVTQNNVVADNTQNNVNILQETRNILRVIGQKLNQSIIEQRQQQQQQNNTNAPQNNTNAPQNNAVQEASISLQEASNTLNNAILAQQNKEASKENSTSSSSSSPLGLDATNAAVQHRNIHAGDLLPKTPTAPIVQADNYNGYTYINDTTVKVNQEFKNQVRQDYIAYKNQFEGLGRIYAMSLPNISLLLYYYRVKYGSNDNLLRIFNIVHQCNFSFFNEVTLGDLDARPNVWQMRREQYINAIGALALNIVSITLDLRLRQNLLYCFANFVGYVFFALGMQSLTYGIGSVDEIYSTIYIRSCAGSQNIENTLSVIDNKSDDKLATTYTIIYAYVVLMGYQRLVQERTINVNRRFPPNMMKGSLSEYLINLLRQYNNMDMVANIGIMNQRLINIYMARLPLNMEPRPLPTVQNIKEVTSVDSEQERERMQEETRRAEIEAAAKASQDERRARFREKRQRMIEENIRRSGENQVKEAARQKVKELFDLPPWVYATRMTLTFIGDFERITDSDIIKQIKFYRIKILKENHDPTKYSGDKHYIQTLRDLNKVTEDEVDEYILPNAKSKEYSWAPQSIKKAKVNCFKIEQCDKEILKYYGQIVDAKDKVYDKLAAERQRREAMVAAKKTTKKASKKAPKKTTTTTTTSNKKAKKSSNHHHHKKK